MGDLLQFLILFGVGYFIGTRVEKSHYASLRAREAAFLRLPAVTTENLIETGRQIERAELVCGSIVISTDFFRLVLSGLHNILGGRVTSYETLLDRGRREAILRLKESAPEADLIVNLRMETCQLSEQGISESLAWGTAVYYRK